MNQIVLNVMGGIVDIVVAVMVIATAVLIAARYLRYLWHRWQGREE